MFSITAGTDGQQLWECISVRIALVRPLEPKPNRIESTWRQRRGLTMLLKMRPASPELAIVARELALRLVELLFPPDAIHTPGVAHEVTG